MLVQNLPQRGGGAIADDHWNTRPLPESPDDLDPVHVWETEIDDDDVRPSAGGLGEPIDPRGRLEQAIALTQQDGPEKASRHRVVLDQDDDRFSHFDDLVGLLEGRAPEPVAEVRSHLQVA